MAALSEVLALARRAVPSAEFAAFWGEALVDGAAKSSLLIALALAACLLLRRRPAPARHAVLAWALAGGLLLPLLGPVVPAIRLSLLPHHLRPFPVSSPSAMAVIPVPEGVPFAPSYLPSSSAIAFPRRPVEGPSALGLAVLLWALGGTLSAGRLLIGMAGVRRLARAARPMADSRRVSVVAEAVKAAGVGRPVRVRVADGCPVPMTFGLFRPGVLLPSAADSWDLERLRAVVVHELAHVVRRDPLVQALVHLSCSLYWFNPLVWMAAVRLRLERERACDDRVLAAGLRPSAYAQHLVAIARSLNALPPAACTALAGTSQIEQRLRSILDPSASRNRVTGPARAFTGAAAAAALSLAASLDPWARPAQAVAPLTPVQMGAVATEPEGLRTSEGQARPRASQLLEFLPEPGRLADPREPAPLWRARAPGRAEVWSAEEFVEGSAVDAPGGPSFPGGVGTVLFMGPGDPAFGRLAGESRRRERPASSRRFAVGFGGEMVHPRGMMSKTSKGLRVRGTYALEAGTDVEMTFSYAPLRIEGELVSEGSVRSAVFSTQDQFTVGMGVRRTYQPEAPRSLYWSFAGGVASVPGTALVRSYESATLEALDAKWGYFFQPRLGLVFVAKEVPSLSLDVSAGLDVISWSQFSTIQQTLTLGLRYAL